MHINESERLHTHCHRKGTPAVVEAATCSNMFEWHLWCSKYASPEYVFLLLWKGHGKDLQCARASTKDWLQAMQIILEAVNVTWKSWTPFVKVSDQNAAYLFTVSTTASTLGALLQQFTHLQIGTSEGRLARRTSSGVDIRPVAEQRGDDRSRSVSRLVDSKVKRRFAKLVLRKAAGIWKVLRGAWGCLRLCAMPFWHQ